MKTKFEIMRANRVARPAPVVLLVPSAPSVPTMTIDGVEYVEAADGLNSCRGCAFDSDDAGCTTAINISDAIFGSSCGPRRVIYVKAA